MTIDPFGNVHTWGGSKADLARVQAKYVDWLANCRQVLDIGCGRGYFIDMLQERGATASGIDYDLALVAACQERGLGVEQADAMEYLRQCQRTFGGIFCGHVVEHLAADQGEALVRECARILDPGGRLVLVTDNPAAWRTLSDWFWRDLTHARPYPLSLLRALFEHYGLRVLASGPDPDTVVARHGSRDAALRTMRRVVLGRELFDAIYGAGSIFIVGEKQ